jgi:hypothetical protein
MRMRNAVLFIVILVWGGLALVPSTAGAATYQGTVIDAETKEPLEGAVVVVVWYKKPLISMNGPQYLHKATEVLTDAEGRFSIDASSGINWNPLTRVLKRPEIDPVVVIFMPGYGPFPEAQVRPKFEAKAKESMLKGGVVVELPRLKTDEELIRFTDIPCCGIHLDDVTIRHIPNLLRLINAQASSLGLGYMGPEEQRPRP